MSKTIELTDKQQRFVEEYIVDFNATQAAIRSGYSKKTAQVIGSENLSKPLVKAAIAERAQKLSDGTDINVERWLREVGRIAFFDQRKLYDENDQFKEPKDWDDDTAAAIAGLEISEFKSSGEKVERLKKIKTMDKKQALDMLGKYFKVLTDKVEHDVSDRMQRVIEKGIEIANKYGGIDNGEET